MRARTFVAVAGGAVLLAVTIPSVAAQTAPPTPSPYPPQPAYVNGSCFWGPVLDWHVPAMNTAGPDTAAMYWYTKYQVPPGATITLKGDFPHGRYMSFTTYKTVDGEP